MDLPSMREWVTALHGMLFTAVLFVAFPAAFIELVNAGQAASGERAQKHLRRVRALTRALADVAWLAVITGTLVVYPWYRAVPPEGVADLAPYPRSLLTSTPGLEWWHVYGMEWKEHVAWLVPILLAAAAHLSKRHGELLFADDTIRRAVMALLALAFAVTALSGLLGAFVSRAAPVL